MKSKFLKYAGPFCSLILFAGALWILGHEVQTVRLQHILPEIKAIPGERFWPAVVLTVLSYTLMTGYDFLAIRFIKHTLSIGKIALASFLGYAFINNIGLSMLAGASVRYRELYSGWGLSALDITKMVSFCTVSLWLGFFGLGGAVFVWEPLAIPPGWRVRARRPGDRMRQQSDGTSRKLKHFFQSASIPPWLRAGFPVLEWDGEPVALGDWVLGHRLRTWLLDNGLELIIDVFQFVVLVRADIRTLYFPRR